MANSDWFQYIQRVSLRKNKGRKVYKPATKAEVKLTVNIVAGLGTEYQRRCWSAFWRKLIGESKSAEKRMPPSQAPGGNALTGSAEENGFRE